MYTANFTKIDKQIKKALDIPTPTILKKAVLTIKELDGFMRNIAKHLEDSGTNSTFISFEIANKNDKGQGPVWTFDDIEIKSTDANLVTPIISDKVAEDVANSAEEATDEDIQLASQLEAQMSVEDTQLIGESRPFDKHFGTNKKPEQHNQEEVVSVEGVEDNQLPDLFGTKTETPEVVENPTDDLFGPAEDEDDAREGEQTDLSASESTEVTDNSLKNDSEATDQNTRIEKNKIDYDSYITTGFVSSNIVDFNQERFAKKAFFEKFGLPSNASEITKNDYVAIGKFKFLEREFNSLKLESLRAKYISSISQLDSELRANLSDFIKKESDPVIIKQMVNDQLNQDLNEKNEIAASDFNEFKNEKESARDHEINMIIEQAEKNKEAAIQKIQADADTQVSKVKTEYAQIIKNEEDKTFEKFQQYEETRRGELVAATSELQQKKLIEYKTEVLAENESKFNDVNTDYANQYDQAIENLQKELNRVLPNIELQATKKVHFEVEESHRLEQERLQKREIELKEKELSKDVNHKADNPVNVVLPAQTDNGHLEHELIDLLKNSQNKNQPLVAESTQSKTSKPLVGLIIGLSITTILSLGGLGYTAIQANNNKINNLNNQISSMAAKNEVQKESAKTNSSAEKAKPTSLNSLLANKDYAAAYDRYQDNQSLVKIANTMLENNDTAALKNFNKKFDLPEGQLDQAILEKNNEKLSELNKQMTEKQKDQLTGLQLRSLEGVK